MEELKKRYEQLLKSYDRLEYMRKAFLDLLHQEEKELAKEETPLVIHRESLIKRFELCYDLTWKFFKKLLIEKYDIEANSPRKVFQECFKQSIISEQEVISCIRMIDSRNSTTHMYNLEMAREISLEIVEYSIVLRNIMQRITID
jgi:nucleotidyltransferase substrate binding protein (TIGR01987 family)